MTKQITLVFLLCSLALPCMFNAPSKAEPETSTPDPESIEKINVMLLDGQMSFEGHKWAETSPIIKAILDATGRFKVNAVTSPEKGKPNDDFCPAFADYDVIVVNYEGDNWPQKTRKAFVEYIQKGGGLVVIHAADNGFPQWQEWNEMIGFGGWGGRNEESGPMIWWENDKIKYDISPGSAGYHGKRADWLVTIRDKEHPITKGLPEKWMHCCDELYSKMRGPGKNMHVLATGWQTPDQGGTGRNEICLFTVTYSRGRIFHTTMGHDTESISCVGFILTLQRGTEWAAIGKVTLTDIPSDFPTDSKTSTRDMKKQENQADKAG